MEADTEIYSEALDRATRLIKTTLTSYLAPTSSCHQDKEQQLARMLGKRSAYTLLIGMETGPAT